jgi:hypothetical protein
MNKSSGQIITAYVKNKKRVTLKPKQNWYNVDNIFKEYKNGRSN